MNKRLILLPALLMAVTTLIFTGCSKDEDTTAPVITLNGDATMEIDLQEAYSEPGANAIDGEDGDVTVSITGTVNNDLKGDYTITYTATDGAGNTATEERIVTVVNSADFLAGTYLDAVDDCQSTPPSIFDAIVTTSNTDNGKFTVNNFGAFGTSVNIVCQYFASNNLISAITPQSLGAPALLTTVYNSSTVMSTTPVTFQIVYEWNDGGASEICTSTYTK